jgi:dipeptide transport system ATP-binding protein
MDCATRSIRSSSGESALMPLLQIEDLRVEFGSEREPLIAVDGVDLDVDTGEVVGLVGESGSGKSVTALAAMGLVDFPGRVRAKRLALGGQDLLMLGDAQRRLLVGKEIAMIFQDPLASLNPCFTVAFQLTETLRVHGTEAERSSARQRRARALELLRQVEIPDPEARLAAFPHQLSGGMAQRVMIAIAIACQPKLLIADEPTTALDVTVQAQVLELLLRLQREQGMALILITHDLAIVAETAQRVVVMYAGQVVETGPVPAIFETPRHPYTQALLAALPEHNRDRARLEAIPGVVPGQYDRPAACLLHPRCAYAVERCRRERPPLSGPQGRQVRCHFALDAAGRPTGGWRPEARPAVGETGA